VLPALRRTFGGFAPPERRAIGEQAGHLDGSGRVPDAAAAASDELDEDRAVLAVRTVAAILGLGARSGAAEAPAQAAVSGQAAG
jgi:hypothetical protein